MVMLIKKSIRLGLGFAIAASLAACGGMTTNTKLKGDRVKGEIVRSAGGLMGDDVTTGVVDFQNHAGQWKSEDFLVTSTSFGKQMMSGLVPGLAVAAVQARIAKYQVDNQCDDACGDIINVLSTSESSQLTKVQVNAIAEIVNKKGGQAY